LPPRDRLVLQYRGGPGEPARGARHRYWFLSDIVFGLFAICGYQFAPRISDIGDAQQWWIDLADVGLAGKRTTPSANGYGRLSELGLRHA